MLRPRDVAGSHPAESILTFPEVRVKSDKVVGFTESSGSKLRIPLFETKDKKEWLLCPLLAKLRGSCAARMFQN